jgi:hypothetical protein
MPINFSSLGGSSGGGVSGDFVINTGDYSSDTAELSRDYEAGAYGILVSPTDATLDIYLVASDGSFAGYSNIGSITATAPFDKVVVLGSTSNTSLSFSFNGESQIPTAKGQLVGAGAVVGSVVTSSLPNADDSTVVNGGNFAADVEVTFIDQSAVETSAKTIVRSSSTQLIVTRPDTFSPENSPYTLKVVNPGIPEPSGTDPHLLSNSVTAGTNPVWTTGTTIVYLIGAETSHTLLATDTESSDIDYSIVSGTLPAGISLDGETGVISGTASGTPADGDVTSVTIRAIDAGGNFLDKAFDFTANLAPTWTTSGAGLQNPLGGAAYSAQLVASGGTTGGVLSYTLQSGAFHIGHTMNAAGVISGATSDSTGDTATFTVRVTDEGGLFADRQFTTVVSDLYAFTSHTFTNANAVGYAGPTLSAARASYSTTWDDAYLNMTTNGIQKWTVPATGSYRIEVSGASSVRQYFSGNFSSKAGRGASFASNVSLTAGQEVDILCGQLPTNVGGLVTSYNGGTYGTSGEIFNGGGGGTFVYNSSTASLLLAAGGGASERSSNSGSTQATMDASSNFSGNGNDGLGGSGGSGGFGGQDNNNTTDGTAGAGYQGDGSTGGSSSYTLAKSFLNGGEGSITNGSGPRRLWWRWRWRLGWLWWRRRLLWRWRWCKQ